MLMVSNVQDEFHHFFCFDHEKGLGNRSKSQDYLVEYLVSYPTVDFWYIYLDFNLKSQ